MLESVLRDLLQQPATSTTEGGHSFRFHRDQIQMPQGAPAELMPTKKSELFYKKFKFEIDASGALLLEPEKYPNFWVKMPPNQRWLIQQSAQTKSNKEPRFIIGI